MDGKVRHESPRLHLEQQPKNGTMSHGNLTTTSSNSSSTTTIQPGSSDSELCRLMSSCRSLESLGDDDDDDEESTPRMEGETYEEMDSNRGTAQTNSQAEEEGETSPDEAAEYDDDETEDYGLVIEKHFQQLYGFKTPYNCRLLDEEWCNQVFKPSANVSISWSDMQPFNATAQQHFTNQHPPSVGQATDETEIASISSFLQVSNNRSNECKYKTSQQLAESGKVFTAEIPDDDRSSQNQKISTDQTPDTSTNFQKTIETLQLHESDEDIRNAVAKEIVFSENFATPRSGSRTSLRVEVNSRSATGGWTATSDSPSQHGSAQFASPGSKLMDAGDSCLEDKAGTTQHQPADDIPAGAPEDDIADQILPINEWPVNSELSDHPLNLLYLLNELAIMNDYVVVRNLVDARPLTDNDRFAVGMARGDRMVRGDRCTIEEIVSEEDTDRSTSASATAANNYVKNPTNDDSDSTLMEEEEENEIHESTRSVTQGQNENAPKSSPEQPEEYVQNVSFRRQVKKDDSQYSDGQEDSPASIQDQQVLGKNSTKIISNMLRYDHTEKKNSPTDEMVIFPRITDAEKTRKSRIPRRKSGGPAFSCKPPRDPSTIETTEGTCMQLKTDDLACGGDSSEASVLSKNSRIPCETRKTIRQQLTTDKARHSKHEACTHLCSKKSENHISWALLDGEWSERSCSSERQTDDLKLPAIRLNRYERASGSNVMPPNSLAANENARDLFESHGLKKSRGHLRHKNQQLRSQLLAKLTAMPTRKQRSSSTFLKLPSLSLQSTPVRKQSHPLAMRRPYTPPNRNVLEARAQWPQFYTSHPSDIDRGVPRKMALKDVPSLKKVAGFSYGVYE